MYTRSSDRALGHVVGGTLIPFCNILYRHDNRRAMDKTFFHRGARSRAAAIALMMFIGVTVAAAAGCNSRPKVSYQFDSKTDFAALHTYGIEPTHSPTLDLRMLDSKPMAERIAESIEQQLQARGLSRAVPPAAPDLLVRWTAQIEYEQASGDMGAPGVDVDINDPDSGAFLDTGPPGGGGVPAEVAEGGIKIDLVSARTKHVVWRGGVASVLRRDQPDPKRVARLDAALKELFGNYPPKVAPKAAASAAR